MEDAIDRCIMSCSDAEISRSGDFHSDNRPTDRQTDCFIPVHAHRAESLQDVCTTTMCYILLYSGSLAPAANIKLRFICECIQFLFRSYHLFLKIHSVYPHCGCFMTYHSSSSSQLSVSTSYLALLWTHSQSFEMRGYVSQ